MGDQEVLSQPLVTLRHTTQQSHVAAAQSQQQQKEEEEKTRNLFVVVGQHVANGDDQRGERRSGLRHLLPTTCHQVKTMDNGVNMQKNITIKKQKQN